MVKPAYFFAMFDADSKCPKHLQNYFLNKDENDNWSYSWKVPTFSLASFKVCVSCE
jgi:hypothetical protein